MQTYKSNLACTCSWILDLMGPRCCSPDRWCLSLEMCGHSTLRVVGKQILLNMLVDVSGFKVTVQVCFKETHWQHICSCNQLQTRRTNQTHVLIVSRSAVNIFMTNTLICFAEKWFWCRFHSKRWIKRWVFSCQWNMRLCECSIVFLNRSWCPQFSSFVVQRLMHTATQWLPWALHHLTPAALLLSVTSVGLSASTLLASFFFCQGFRDKTWSLILPQTLFSGLL